METLKRFFKKHNKKIIAFIGVLATTICGVLGITKTYAWTYNEQTDTISSDNLISINNSQSSSNGISYNINNGVITLNGSIDSSYANQYLFIELPLNNIIESGDYSVNWCNNTTNERLYCYFGNRFGSGDYTLAKFLTTTNASASGNMANGISQLRLRFEKNYSYDITIKPMLVSGLTIPNEFEPYGKTFIDKSLYDSLENGFEYLQQEYLNLLEEHEQLVNNYTNLQSQFNTLQSDYNSLNTNYTNLQAQFDNLTRNYQDLQDDYDELLSDYNDLQDDYTTLENNYNDLQANGINNLYGGLYASLNGSIAKLYNVDNPSLNYLLTQTPYATTTLEVTNFSVGPGELGLIVEADNNHDLVDRCLILYTLHNPMYFNSLTFTRVENNQSRYIYLYFNDNTTETITLYDSGEFDVKSTTWFNNSNKYLTHIITDCEPGYDVVHTISNTSDGQAYENGYDKGYAVGYNDHQSSITQAYNDLKDKYSNAYDNGYNAGFEAADRSEFASSGINNLFNAILSYPVNFIKQVFNFEFMGVNVSAIITFIISIGIVAFIVNYFRKH